MTPIRPHHEPPSIDKRTFQDLVDHAKREIQSKCTEWTDHNVSDPGIMLVELYAYMTELMLHRLNQTPEQNYLAFLKLIGVSPEPAQPAKGEVRFKVEPLAKDERVIIPAGTELTPGTQLTTSDGSRERVIYSTDKAVTVMETKPIRFLTAGGGDDWVVWDDDYSNQFAQGQPVTLWAADGESSGAKPRFAIGFENDLSRHLIEITLDPDPRSASVPTISWRVYSKPDQVDDGNPAWEELLPQPDDPSRPASGSILLQLPHQCTGATLKGQDAGTWIVGVPRLGGQTARTEAKAKVQVLTKGVSLPVSQSRSTTEEYELLGLSSGKSGQAFALRFKPVLRPADPERFVWVERPDQRDWEPWKVVPDFAESAASSSSTRPLEKHCVLDLREGKVVFGPSIDGVQFGAIPTPGARIRVGQYHVGGGEKGNLPAGSKLRLMTTIPKLFEVGVNRTDLTGGRDAETVGIARQRTPGRVRQLIHKWPVTRADFQEHVGKMPGVGAVYCVQQGDDGDQTKYPDHYRTRFEAGTVKLLIVPSSLPRLDDADNSPQSDTEKFLQRRRQFGDPNDLVPNIKKDELVLPDHVRKSITGELDRNRLMTMKTAIEEPIYVLLSVKVTIGRPEAEQRQVRQRLELDLYRYFHPLLGGDGHGWAFNGRYVTPDLVYRVARQVPGIGFDIKVQLRVYEKQTISATVEDWQLSPDQPYVLLDSRSVLYSGRHEVEFK